MRDGRVIDLFFFFSNHCYLIGGTNPRIQPHNPHRSPSSSANKSHCCSSEGIPKYTSQVQGGKTTIMGDPCVSHIGAFEAGPSERKAADACCAHRGSYYTALHGT